MNPSPSPDRYSFDKRIQDAQGDIDRLDSKLDSKIDIAGLPQEQKDALKQAYIDKVNAVQGQVRRSFEKIDVQRDLRSDEWRKWEDDVLGVEADLYILLSDEYEKLRLPDEESIAVVGLADFNLKIDELLNEVSALGKKYEEPEQSAESIEKEAPTPRSIEEIFREWNVPGSGEEIAYKATMAVEHYGEKQVRDLAAALSLYESLPTPLKDKLFKTTAPLLRQQVAGQLANGTFETSPLAFLLTEDFEKVEEHVLAERERILDEISKRNETMHALQKETNDHIVEVCKTAKIDVGSENVFSDIWSFIRNTNGKPEVQREIIDKVKEFSKDISDIQMHSNELSVQLKQIEYAFNSFDTTIARNEGKKAKEAQLLFRTKIDFEQNVQISDSQLQLLRPAQQQLLEGRHDDAVRSSIDTFNVFVEQNPDLDTLDRVDLLQLSNASRVKPDGARFESVDVGWRNPFSRFDVRNAGFSRLRPTLGRDELLMQQPQTITVLRELGQLKEGGELILVELPRVEGGGGETAIALRDSEGVVRLQDGTVLEDPSELRPMKINSPSAYGRTVYVSPETEMYLRSNVNSRLSSRVILREGGVRETRPIAPFATGPIYTLDTSQLQLASRNDKGELILYDTNGNREQSIDADRLRKESIEQGRDVLRSIDHNPLIQDISQRAGELQGNMQNMQMMLQTAMSGEANVGDAFVEQLRDYARPMLGVLEDSTTKEKVLQAKELLQSELQRVKHGKLLGRGMESEIQNRIDALDGYIAVLNDNQLLHGLQTAMDASKVRPDTWVSWLNKDGLIMLGAITSAVVAIAALTILTGGMGLIAISAAGAGAGIVGAEGTKELLYQYHNRGISMFGFRAGGGASTGQYRYADGSRVGNYFRDQKLFDPRTGEFVEMEFLGDVAFPYAQEFLVSFATTALALGAGQVAGNALSKLAQNSKMMQALAKNSGIANNIMKRLSGLSDDAARAPQNVNEFARNVFKETLDELGDEAMEGGVEQVLASIDGRLAFLSTLIVASGKGFKPLAGGQLAYESSMSAADVRAWTEQQGHTVVSKQNGVFDVKTFDGKSLILKPIDPQESTKQEITKNAAYQLAEAGDVTALKEYLKTHDVDTHTRRQLAETLLGRPLKENEWQAILKAHNLSGTIDALSVAGLRAKTEELSKGITNQNERRLVIEAGIAGHSSTYKSGDSILFDREVLLPLSNGRKLPPGTYTLIVDQQGNYFLREGGQLHQISPNQLPKKAPPKAPPPPRRKQSQQIESTTENAPLTLDQLELEAKKYDQVKPIGQKPAADPDNVKIQKGETVWLTQSIQGGAIGLCTITESKGSYFLVLPDTADNHTARIIPLTSDVQKKLAPVHNLAAESVQSLRTTSGWKLHLNFNPANTDHVRKVETVLKELKEKSIIVEYKIGHGGGIASGQPGKESTVYVGHGAKAKIVTEYLETRLNDVLLPATPEVMADDHLFSERIAGRFDLNGDAAFHQYGSKGIPYLQRDMANRNRKNEEARSRADQILRTNYGEFYASGFEGETT